MFFDAAVSPRSHVFAAADNFQRPVLDLRAAIRSVLLVDENRPPRTAAHRASKNVVYKNRHYLHCSRIANRFSARSPPFGQKLFHAHGIKYPRASLPVLIFDLAVLLVERIPHCDGAIDELFR